MTGIRLPNESREYRRARQALLEAELELREQIERVNRQRRELPLGGEVPQDYVFEELRAGEVRETLLSDLFAPGHDTLFLYSFMYAPNMEGPCPMCTCLLDGLEGQIRHIQQNISTAVVAKHDVHSLQRHADARGWRNLRLVSSRLNSYNVDYFGEIDGMQTTAANVFVKKDDQIHHFWNAELSYAGMMEGGHMRHLDQIWPLWGVLDTTPGGRGEFFPSLDYDSTREDPPSESRPQE